MTRIDVSDVPGWFDPVDQALFHWVLETQTGAGTTGDVAEMGVYLGKSACLVGAHLQPGETFTVVDLFEDPAGTADNLQENADQYGGLTQRAFEKNYRAFHPQLPTVVKGYSSEIVAVAAAGTHRFVHVDASHLYEHVATDVTSARALLAPDGIVVFDDIRSPHTPGTWAAVWEAVITHDLKPVLVSGCKLYGTWGDAPAWRERFLAAVPDGLDWELQDVLGEPLVRVWAPEPVRPPSWRYVEALTPPALLRRIEPVVLARLARRGS